MIQCGVRTAIEGDFGAAADAARLAGLLESAIAGRDRPVRIVDAAISERELAAFDYVVVEDTEPSTNEAGFEFAMTQTAALGLHFEAIQLAADRVLEVVEREGSLFLGHGLVVAEGKANFYVEAVGDAWSRQGLRAAGPQAAAARTLIRLAMRASIEWRKRRPASLSQLLGKEAHQPRR